jgi:hypothetical protein
MVYQTLTVNLSGDEYDKVYVRVCAVINDLGGSSDRESGGAFILPVERLEEFTSILRRDLQINNISLKSSDMSEQYGALKGVIAQLESDTSFQNGEDGGNGVQAQLDEKKGRIKEIEEKAANVYIIINRT